jgi:hypothetical protein
MSKGNHNKEWSLWRFSSVIAVPPCSCSCPLPIPVHPFIAAIPAYITTLLGALVAYVAVRQWLTARDKLRLDLYDRRFAIYKVALDFYSKVTMGDWKNDPETDLSSQRFVVALQESLFLFDEEDGIYTMLKEFSDKAFHIIQMKKGNLTAAMIGPELYLKEFQKFSNELAWINENMPLLSGRMAPYLNFHRAK